MLNGRERGRGSRHIGGNSQPGLQGREEGAGESGRAGGRARGRAVHGKKLTPGPPTSAARCWQSDRV